MSKDKVLKYVVGGGVEADGKMVGVFQDKDLARTMVARYNVCSGMQINPDCPPGQVTEMITSGVLNSFVMKQKLQEIKLLDPGKLDSNRIVIVFSETVELAAKQSLSAIDHASKIIDLKGQVKAMSDQGRKTS